VVRDGARWVVVDGYKRVRALSRLGQDVLQAVEWQLGELDALVLERVMRGGSSDSAIEEGWLLRELMQRFGLRLDELGRRFDRSRSWVSRRLGLVTDLPESVQRQVHVGAIGAHAAMKYLVPLARANAAHCEELGKQLGGLHPTSRQVAQLYAAYLAGNTALRERIIEQPALVLKAQAELERAGEEPSVGEQLLRDARIVTSVSRRAARKLSDGALDGATPEERSRALEQCQEAFWETERLWKRCQKETSHAGSDDAQRDSSAA